MITGLGCGSTATAESLHFGRPLDRLDQIRSGELDHECVRRSWSRHWPTQIAMDAPIQLPSIFRDLVRAPALPPGATILADSRVASSSTSVARTLQGRISDQCSARLVPRTYDDASQWPHPTPRRARWPRSSSLPLVLCIDQLEDIYNLDDAEGRFRRTLATALA